jgi:hypothetical protein
VEDDDLLADANGGGASGGLFDVSAKEVLLERLRGVDVDRAGNVPAVVFVVKPTVDN